MTAIVHIANTNVEFEYTQTAMPLSSIEESWSRHSLCLQLQFLPLLYAQPTDIIAVSHLPSPDYLEKLQQIEGFSKHLPQLILLKEIEPFKTKRCCAWGPSRQIQNWALEREMQYDIPKNWDMLRLMNSKAYSFRYNPLSQASLLYHEKELREWLQKTQGSKVLKTCFGLSGQGNRKLDESIPSSETLAFCAKEWHQKRPIIGEPWLNRIYDFSTQWYIHPNQTIEWIGATRFETNAQGHYQGTLAGPEELLFASIPTFLKEHRRFALNVLKEMAQHGFFGPVGLDALIYQDATTQQMHLYPLVEINARQTMSLVALKMQQRFYPTQIVRLSFHTDSSAFSLLPQMLVNAKGKMIPFRRALTMELVSVNLSF